MKNQSAGTKRAIVASLAAIAFAAIAYAVLRPPTTPSNGAEELGPRAEVVVPTASPAPATANDTRDATMQTGEAAATRPKDASAAALVKHVEDGVSSTFAGIPGTRLPVTNLAVEFTSLSAKARNGDLLAARALFDGLQACRQAPRSTEELDLNLSRMDRSNADQAAAAEAMYRGNYAHCAGVTEAQLDSMPTWGGMLAEAGDTFAQLQYQNYVRLDAHDADYDEQLVTARDRAMGYLQGQLEQGNPQALFALQSFYAANRLVGRDPYRSYVYGWAYVLSQGNRLTQAHASYVGLANFEAQLTAQQLEAARSEGLALQKRCCGG